MASQRRREELKKSAIEKYEALRRAHVAAFGPRRTSQQRPFGRYTGPNLSPRFEDGVKIPSLQTMACATAKVDAPRYTGENLIGVALMHKSNYVPVFKQEDAVAIAKMRRG